MSLIIILLSQQFSLQNQHPKLKQELLILEYILFPQVSFGSL